MFHAAAPLLGFLFLSPLAALATAAAAVAVPVVIHLLSRRRYRVVTWAAMRFLQTAQKQSARKMRLEQLLLLAARCALLLLLVLAMASVMPWAEALWHRLFPDQAVLAGTGPLRTHKILVLDGSFSMALKNGEESCFDQARERALQILNTAAGGDGFSVVLMAAPPRTIVPGPSDDARKVAEEIRLLRLPHGNADLAATLNAVDGLLRGSPDKFEAREVYFLTDLQRATWSGPSGVEWAESMQRVQGKARVVFVDVGQDGMRNVAISHLTLGSPLVTTGISTPVTATLHNYGSAEAASVRVELLVGKARTTAAEPTFEPRVVAQQIVRVPPGRGGVTVAFPYQFAAPGDHVVQVRLENDALEVDNSRALVITVKDTVPVMLVNGKPAAEPLDQATQFLRVALNPFEKGPVPRDVPARPRVLSESQFADAALGDLTPYDCVFLCDVARLGSAEVRRLETHLRRGGGVVFCLGPRVDLEAYNRLIYRNGQGILPARLLGMQRAAEDRVFSFYAEEDTYRQPPLEAFAADLDRTGLLGARFRQYVRAELPAKGGARKVLAFMPEADNGSRSALPAPPSVLPVGDPAIVAWSRHRGRVVLVTTTANMDWTSWPASPSYPVLMQELLRFAVAGRLHEQAMTVGAPLEEYLPAAHVGIGFQVHTPDGRTVEGITQTRDDTAHLAFADTDSSGIYRVTFGSNPREFLYAVNVPATTPSREMSESDPARYHANDLQTAYPAWEFQIVTDPKETVHVSASSDGPRIMHGMGSRIAGFLLWLVFLLAIGEMVLAWRLGRYSKSSVPVESPATSGRLAPLTAAGVFGLVFLVLAGVLAHAARTRDFLGFLPERFRGGMETALDVPQPVPGESTHWRLEYRSYLLSDATGGRWAAAVLGLAALALVLAIYHREGRTASRPYRLLLAGLRGFFILLMVAVLLPQLQVWFERQSWPDLAILIDDSQSMSAVDQYRDPRVKEAAENLARTAHLAKPERLALAQALLTHEKPDWLGELLTRHQVKVHVYRCSSELARIADLTQTDERDQTVQAVRGLQASREPSRLGNAVREVLGQFRGSSLAAIVMLTDGVNTDGEDLTQASRQAVQMGVPLTFIGLGDAHEVRDLILNDLQVEDTVFVNDRLVFEARLTARGYTDLPPVPVTLYEKTKDGKLQRLVSEKVAIDPQGKPVKFRLTHRPTAAGEKVYVLDVPVQPDEARPAENNRLERTVFVREAKPSRVLYIEGYARPEFRFLKSLLERESTNEHGNKSIELKVLLLDAQEDWHLQDKSARPDFPTKEELNQFDVVILGDVSPKHPKIGEKNLGLLVDFVRERGGGLLSIAGKRDNPHSYKDTPLADVLPIQVVGPAPAGDPDASRRSSFRPRLTALGRAHPIFRFSPDEAENATIWNHLAEIYWFAEGYRLQPAAEVLAVHPKREAIEPGRPGAGGDDRQPLIVQHFVGSGRCLFLGIEETWAWGFREDLLRYNQFWIQTVHYLARSRLGRVDLRLDRQTSYRRGEPIRVTVRFPDDSPPPGAGSAVRVLVERRAPKSAEIEVRTLQLAKLEGSRATYEGLLTRTPDGDYRFALSEPTVSPPQPRAECRVLPPPGEMERLRMNQSEMERAAERTRGHFYDLADADRFLDELQSGNRVALATPGPPWRLWNHFGMFALAIGLLGTEWILRKRKHLL